MTTLSDNPFASGAAELPDLWGGQSLIAVMEDGEDLCERCVTDPTNPVANHVGRRCSAEGDGWAVVAWEGTASREEDAICAHCSHVIGTQRDEPVA